MVVAAVPLLMVGAIRVIAIFYTLALTLIIVGIYMLIAIKDSKKKQPSLHLLATSRYLIIVSILTIVLYVLL